MTLPSFNYFQGVKLTLREKAAGNTTKTIYFIDRPNKQATADGTVYWPILENVSEFGAEMDEMLPRGYTGSFTISNDIGSMGEGRKFGDLLERYAVVHAPAEIHLDAIANGSEAVAIDSNSRAWVARVSSVEAGFDNDHSTLTFNLTQDPIPDQQICCMIDETTTNATATEKQGLGKWLPVAVGEYNYLPAYQMYSGLTTRTYAYGTNIGEKFASTMTSLYGRDVDGEWCLLTSNVSSSHTWGSEATSYSIDSSVCPERLFAIKNASAQNGAISGVKFYMEGNGDDDPPRTSACIMTAVVYELSHDTNGISCRRLASGSLELADFDTENNAKSNFEAIISFDRAVVLNYDRTTYAIGVSSSGWTSGEASIYKCASDTCKVWERGTDGNYELVGETEAAPVMQSYFTYHVPVGFDDLDDAGRAIAGFSVGVFGNEGIADDVFQNLDLIVKTGGILDDSSGTITGGASGALTRPDHFIKALAYTWNGSAWSASSDWDWTTYADDYTALFSTSAKNGRLLLGYQDAPVTFRQMLEAVCRDSMCRVAVTNAGRLQLWPWGRENAISDTIPPEDITPLSWSIGDPSSVINAVRITYGVTNIEVQAFRNKKQKSNYTGTYNKGRPFRGVAQAISANSILCYGRRELAVSETDYVGDSATAKTLVDYYMIRYAEPLILAEIEVPYHKYKTFQLLQTVDFAHPAFPKHSGASPRHAEPYEQGTDVTRAFLKGGRHWHEVKYWRGQIEKWSVHKPPGEAPRTRLLLRVLPNYPIDPT